MYPTHLFALVLVAAHAVLAQIDFQDGIHNTTVIVGTWSSGSMGVVTGSGFAQPANETFTYPNTTGISYSFSEDYFYEIARYRFTGNGSQPNCITGAVSWVHGNYDLLSNGSIIMTPLGDGYMQVEDSCAATSNFVQDYNETEYYPMWRIFTDPTDGYKLHLWQFDGQALAPQFQVSTTPNMLPTEKLRNSSTTTIIEKRSMFRRSTSDAVASWSPSQAMTAILSVGLAGALAMVL